MQIGRANLDGTGIEPAFIDATGAGGLAVDAGHISPGRRGRRPDRPGEPRRDGSQPGLHRRSELPSRRHGRLELRLLGRPREHRPGNSTAPARTTAHRPRDFLRPRGRGPRRLSGGTGATRRLLTRVASTVSLARARLLLEAEAALRTGSGRWEPVRGTRCSLQAGTGASHHSSEVGLHQAGSTRTESSPQVVEQKNRPHAQSLSPSHKDIWSRPCYHGGW